MEQVVIASTESDARAVQAVEQHHAHLAGELALQVNVLVGAASSREGKRVATERDALVSWCTHELLPHALAEEKAMYPAARSTVEGRLLIEGMLGEHEVITGLVEQLAASEDPVRIAASATALQVMFDAHLAKENELVLPLLAAAPEVSVAELLAGMHELLGQAEEHGAEKAEHGAEHGEEHGAEKDEKAEKAEQADGGARRAGSCGGGGRQCGCGETDGPGYPELDARAVPHAFRHATIFGALDTVGPGGGMVLVAPHDPLPLLAQIEHREPGAFEVSYVERGPAVWRLTFVRRSVA